MTEEPKSFPTFTWTQYSVVCPYSEKDAAVHPPVNVMGHYLLEEVCVVIFMHIQKPVDIQVFHLI